MISGSFVSSQQMALVLKYISVYLLSGFKFVFGPAFGIIVYDLPLIAVIALTACGMMTTVYLFTFLGSRLKGLSSLFSSKKRKTFTKRNRQFVRIWKKFGLKGVCFLTPLILTPPGGAIIINVLEGNKQLIVKWMWISAAFWSIVLCILAKYVAGVRDLIQSII